MSALGQEQTSLGQPIILILAWFSGRR